MLGDLQGARDWWALLEKEILGQQDLPGQKERLVLLERKVCREFRVPRGAKGKVDQPVQPDKKANQVNKGQLAQVNPDHKEAMD